MTIRLTTASIAVPSRTWKGDGHLAEIADLLTRTFGGFSQGMSKGYWSDEKGHQFVDDLVVYEIAVGEGLAQTIADCAKLIARIVGEQLYVRIDNEAYLFDFEEAHPGPVLPPVGETKPSAWPGEFDVAILTVIGPELQAVQNHFEIHPQKDARVLRGSLFYRGSARSSLVPLTISVVVYCMGTAGNDSSAMAAERLISRWNPKAIILMGIAAGRREKCRIGDVVTPRLVVDDTLGVAWAKKRLKRPRIYTPPHVMVQQLQNYRLDKDKWHRRLLSSMSPPKPPRGKTKEYQQHVAKQPEHHEAALYSSNLLLRDQSVLERQAAQTHQQIKIGEMEAAGFSLACQERDIPVPWFVVRGVSDFGDDLKDNTFHSWAANSAAAYLLGLVEDGVRVDLLKRA